MPETHAKFLDDVIAGLAESGQKELHCQYLYDDLGSALFEAITYLPEYGLTRADQRLLVQHSAKLPAFFAQVPLIAELGSGSGRKTRYVLEAWQQVDGDGGRRAPDLTYSPIDISQAALSQCEKELSEFARVVPLHGGYLEGVAQASALRSAGQPLLVLFSGSTIGNFRRDAAEQFLKELRSALLPGDMLLIGADLVKPIEQMLLAYDDPTGVTAAFNLNLLGRINRILGGTFDLRQFRHRARYNELERRIEMHLESLIDQEVTIAEAKRVVCFLRGETIFTESSYKYTREEVAALVERTGFRCIEQWIDNEWPFVETLCRVV